MPAANDIRRMIADGVEPFHAVESKIIRRYDDSPSFGKYFSIDYFDFHAN